MKTLLIFLLSTCSLFAQLNISNPFYVATVTRNVASAASATATDTFNRANSSPMSTTMSDGTSTWTSGPGALNDCDIFGNEIRGSAGTSGARVLSPTFAANQYSYVTAGTDNLAVGPAVRLASTTDADGYFAYPSSATSVTFYRIDDTGSIALVALGANVTITALAAGETLGLGISGTTLTLYTNGVSTGATRTDATYSTGQPGIYCGNNVRLWNAFGANDL